MTDKYCVLETVSVAQMWTIEEVEYQRHFTSVIFYVIQLQGQLMCKSVNVIVSVFEFALERPNLSSVGKPMPQTLNVDLNKTPRERKR